jgi:hypothetical protein
MKDKSELEELLFRPILVKMPETEESHLAIIYSCDTSIEQTLNSKGKRYKKISDTIRLLDVTRTLEFGQPVLETFKVDIKRFKNIAQIVPAADHMNEIIAATTLILSEVNRLNEMMANFASIVTTIKSVTQDNMPNQEAEPEGNLILGGTKAPLAHIVFNSINGEQEWEKMLSQKDIIKIAEVLKGIMEAHVSSDLQNEEELKKLRAEIEYKIIDALPDRLRAGDIHINMEAIIDEIRRFLERTEGDQNEGDE